MNRKVKVLIPQEFSYFDKLRNEKVELTPNEEELVITLRPQPSGSEAFSLSQFNNLAFKERFKPTGKLNMELGVAICNVERDNDSLEVSKQLDDPDIANSIPALIDHDGNQRYFIPDEVTVQFNEDLPTEKMENIISELGSEIIIEQRTPGYYTVAVPAEKSLFGLINEFNERSDVIFSEPSEISFNDDLVSVPNDPYFQKLWGLNNKGQLVRGSRGKLGVDIDLLNAWQITKGQKSVILAVIDTGMDMTHPDLAPNLLYRNGEDWDFADIDGSPDDRGSHGSHVCGTVGAAVNNTNGIAGVAPGCSLMPLRINLSEGRNQNRADAINYVTAQAKTNSDRRYVINCSWRASGDFSAITYAIKRASMANVLIVFAAGNSDHDLAVKPQYPAVLPEVICVAALDSSNRKASFSNYGSRIDISAPGVNIYSTVPSSSYGYKNGTSMAAPHVAGVAALVWSVDQSLTNTEVRQILQTSVSDVDRDNPQYQGKLGGGRLNAHLAVSMAMQRKLRHTFSVS